MIPVKQYIRREVPMIPPKLHTMYTMYIYKYIHVYYIYIYIYTWVNDHVSLTLKSWAKNCGEVQCGWVAVRSDLHGLFYHCLSVPPQNLWLNILPNDWTYIYNNNHVYIYILLLLSLLLNNIIITISIIMYWKTLPSWEVIFIYIYMCVLSKQRLAGTWFDVFFGSNSKGLQDVNRRLLSRCGLVGTAQKWEELWWTTAMWSWMVNSMEL